MTDLLNQFIFGLCAFATMRFPVELISSPVGWKRYE
jgi:hypothetical protein